MSQGHKHLFHDRLLQKRLLSTKLSMRGLTLLEVITVVSIISILVGLIVPNMEHFVVKMRVDNEISTLQRLLLLTRNSAINNNSNTILCPLDESGQCSTLWHKELSVFIDINNNRRFDPDNNEMIIRSKAAIKKNDILIYGKRRKSITFHPTGRLSGLSNGTFRYCPLHHEGKSRGIVIARSGRVYTTSDIDNDSKDETRMNKEINCN
jgi:type IV fimbrial biogenesis protein FimT